MFSEGSKTHVSFIEEKKKTGIIRKLIFSLSEIVEYIRRAIHLIESGSSSILPSTASSFLLHKLFNGKDKWLY